MTEPLSPLPLVPLVDDIETARILDVSPLTLRRWRWAGKGPRFVKIGAAVKYEVPTLAAMIEAGRRSSTSEGFDDGEV